MGSAGAGPLRLRRSLEVPDPTRPAVVVAVANLAGLRPAVARELRARLIERLDGLFPSGVLGEEIAPGRVAVPVVSHPGLDRTVDAVGGVLAYEFAGRVSLWIERPPLAREDVDEYLERLRSVTPARVAWRAGRDATARPSSDPAPGSPGRVGNSTLAIVAGSVAMVVFGLAIAGLAAIPSGGALQGGAAVASPPPSERTSGPAPVAPAAARATAPVGSHGREATTTTSGDAVPIDGVAASSGRLRSAVEHLAAEGMTVVAAVGVGEGAARELLPEVLRALPIQSGVPPASEVREDQTLVLVLVGPAPSEVCSLLAARPDTLVFGDAPVCPSDGEAAPGAQRVEELVAGEPARDVAG